MSTGPIRRHQRLQARIQETEIQPEQVRLRRLGAEY
jgi:hypothetical protein